MELKTNVHAEDGKQDLRITREFDLPVDLLFKAYTEPDILEQWMGTKVLKHDSKKHGSYQFETTNEQGIVVFKASLPVFMFMCLTVISWYLRPSDRKLNFANQ